MIKEYTGNLVGQELRMGIVVSRWNDFMTGKLLEGALDSLTRHGILEDRIEIARVPGSFELPLAAKMMVQSGKYDAVICLGVIIRGVTPHFDFVAAETTKGIAQLGLESNIPLTFGIITSDTIEQAIERAGSKGGNKGTEAALAAIEMANLLKQIKS